MTDQSEEKNMIEKMNEQAALNIAKIPRKVEPLTLFGEFNYIPIPLNRKEKMEAALSEINKIIFPTIKKLENPANIMEIQDKVFRKIVPFENQLNSCVMLSKNVTDVNHCADNFVNQLNNILKPHVINILKDY